jgi:penicillin amidase/acyl-homoserine-lactone acylase
MHATSPHRTARRLLPVAALAALLLAGCAIAWRANHAAPPAVPDARQDAWRAAVTIHRDALGVPHVHGRTDAATAFGLAWAHAEDDYPTIEWSLAAARGQLGRVDPGGLSAANDFLVQLFDIPQAAARQYAELPPAFREYLDAYAAGLSYYATRHPDEADARLHPLTGADIVAGFAHKLPLMMGVGEALGNLFRMEAAQLATGAALETRHDEPSPLPDWFRARLAGSNAHAVARARSADDVTRLNVNSHQPWEGPVAWYEAHLLSDEGMNVLGGVFPGSPVVLHGHNAALGWAHTVNRPDLVDVYRLEVREEPRPEYRLDGAWLPLAAREVALPFDIGIATPRLRRTVYDSAHGPVVKTPAGWFALRYPGADRLGKSVYQWYRMGRADGLEAWQEAMRLQYLPMMNTVYADRENVLYVYNALMPLREAAADWRAVLPGDRAALIWERTLAWDALPRVLNPPSGLVFNTNTTPFIATDGAGNPRVEDFAPSFGIERHLNNRALRTLETFGRDARISREAFLRYKFDRAFSADSAFRREVLGPLLRDHAPASADEAHALALLAAWDDEMAPGSTAASVAQLIHEPWQQALEFSAVDTPAPDPARLFAEAVRRLRRDFGRVDVALGELQRLRRARTDLPLGGGADTLNAVHTRDAPRHRVGVAGDSYILLVEFGADGVRSSSRHQYGNVNRPESAHYADQAEAFARRELKPNAFTLEAVRAAAVRSYHPGEG